MIDRYTKNGILEAADQKKLARKKIAVIGCGGLGGYLIEMLGRLGLRHINACDGDVFSVSNLNRQLLATEDNLGTNKAKAAAIRMETVNSEVSVRTFAEYLTPENAARIFDGCDLVIDALDSPQAKCMLEELCEGFRLPLVHGAVEGWFGQVCTVMPGDWTLRSLYQNTNRGDQQEAEKTGNPSFTPAAVAALQVSEALKVLLDKEGILRNDRRGPRAAGVGENVHIRKAAPADKCQTFRKFRLRLPGKAHSQDLRQGQLRHWGEGPCRAISYGYSHGRHPTASIRSYEGKI